MSEGSRREDQCLQRSSGAEIISPSQAAQDIVNWLSGGETRTLDEAGLLEALALRLRGAGIPLDRFTLHIRIPHPELAGYTVAWAPGEPVQIHERAHDFLANPDFVGSPLRRVMETRRPIHVRLNTEEGRAWTHIDVFQNRGLVELFIVSLSNREGPSAAAFSTAAPEGFSAADWIILSTIVPAMRSAFELRVLRRVERLLLDIYTGPNTAQRILAGQIKRGQVETIEVALLLCDLRGFTELSNRLPTPRILQLLDLYFDQVVPRIEEAGGEVLKFMGDAVLAYFRNDDAGLAAASALRTATTILDRLARLTLPDATLTAGIALHYGAVSYGNIGTAHRLDFTVVGRDVNLVSRIQGVCAAAGEPILLSRTFAGLVPGARKRSIGKHILKGFPEAIELFAVASKPQRCSSGADAMPICLRRTEAAALTFND